VSAENKTWRKGSSPVGVHRYGLAKGASKCSGLEGEDKVKIHPKEGSLRGQLCMFAHDLPFARERRTGLFRLS
jgi:hypothetical protein